MLFFVQDLITKWEKYVLDHQTYRECYLEFTQWASDAKEKLDACRSAGDDQSSLQDRNNQLQVITNGICPFRNVVLCGVFARSEMCKSKFQFSKSDSSIESCLDFQ